MLGKRIFFSNLLIDSMVHTKLELEEIIEIGHQFGLDVLTAVPAKEGLRNSNYIIKAFDRNFDSIVQRILRICEDQSPDEAVRLVSALHYLTEKGFPTQKPEIPWNSQLVMHNSKPVIALKYISGKTIPNLNGEQLSQLGQHMALLHQLDVPDFLPQDHPFGFEAYKTRFKGIEHPYRGWLNNRKHCFSHLFSEDLPKSIIHGDLFSDNVIYDCDNDKKLVGIIDFESAFYGPCIFDLGMTTIGACRDEGILNYDKVRALVKGYEKERPLEPREKELLKVGASQAAAVISIWRFDYFNLRCNEIDNLRYLEAVKLSNHLDSLSNDQFMESVFGK